jgi:hypothetical protein
MQTLLRVLCAAVSVLCALSACDRNSAPPPSSEPAPAEAPAAPAAPAAPEATPPAAKAPATAVAPAGTPAAGGLTWDAPKPFVRRQPRSSMRAAEYGIEGEPNSELGVFFFGPDQGGGVDANIERWVGQFSQPDGSPTKSKRSERKVKGIEVALVEATGTYSGGMAMPGGPAPSAMNDAMLLAAIAKGPGGTVFFKLVGPRASVEGARVGFDGLVDSLRPSAP